MIIANTIFLYDFNGAVVATVVSIVVCFAIIAGLLLYVMRSKKRKNMVHNKKKPNDNPRKQK